ncbi:TldD/PmbA family protein [bacterium]|nr:TldD/PmbA family protein [bacterium]
MTAEHIIELLDTIIKSGRSDALQVTCSEMHETPTRFAGNQVTYGAETEQIVVTFTAYQGKRQASARVNSLDTQILKDTLKRAESAAASAPELEAALKPLGPQNMPPECSDKLQEQDYLPETRGRMVEFACQSGRKEQVECSGYISVMNEQRIIVNTTGLKARSNRSTLEYSLTAQTRDGKGSGWSGAWAPHLTEIDYQSITRKTIDLAKLCAEAREIKPGRYPVLLSPHVTECLLHNWSHHLDAESINKGLSSLAKASTQPDRNYVPRLGDQVISPLLSIKREIAHPLICQFAFDEWGVPSHDLTVINKGVLEKIYYSLPFALSQNVIPTGDRQSFLMIGSDKTEQDLIASLERGIYVTKLWYVTWVNPQDITLTGMTRDGTFWIENGQIKYPIKNLRFNQSVVKLFSEVSALGKTVRYWPWPYACPAIVAPEFNFTSSTDAV